MSTLIPALQFDFKSIENGEIINKQNSAYNGTVKPGCTIVNDPVMGKCLQFDGTSGFVSLPAFSGVGDTDFSKEITIAAWVNADVLNNACIIDLYTGSSNENISLQIGNGKPYAYVPANGIASNTSIVEGEWYHFAVTLAPNGYAFFYINGRPTTTVAQISGITLGSPVYSSNAIGKGLAGNKSVGLFQGKLAWLSVYNTALTIDQVNADMLKGEANRISTFRKSLPVDFNLYSDNNTDHVPVLYIEQEGDGKKLHLEVINKDKKQLNILQATGPAAEKEYHFQLNFRPGTLSDNFLKKKIKAGATTIGNWSVLVGTDQSSGTDYINFLRTGASIALKQNEGHTIVIDGVNANAMGGARNTNVEFEYKKVRLGKTEPLTPLSTIKGSRIQSLSIVSHLGQKDIPLHVDVVGAPVILNDGSTKNELLFRIENTSSNSIPLSTTTNAPTKFEVGVLVQPTGEMVEWALVKQTDIDSLSLDWPILGVVEKTTHGTETTTITLEEPVSKNLSAKTKLSIQPPTGSSFSIILKFSVVEGSYTVTSTKLQTIPKGSIVSIDKSIGSVKTFTTSTNTITLNQNIDVAIPASKLLTITPPSDFFVTLSDAYTTGKSLQITSEKKSIPTGDNVILITLIGKVKETTIKSTGITLIDKLGIEVGSTTSTELIIFTPSGDKIPVTLVKTSAVGTSKLTIKNPTSIPEGSTVSLKTKMGSVASTTPTTITLDSTFTLPKGIAAPLKGTLLTVSSSCTEFTATTADSICASGHPTITFKDKQSIPKGSIISLASAEKVWNIIENNQIAASTSSLLEWTITNQSISDLVSGGSIEFLLKGIVCALPAGQTFVTINYYNIPGYWDGKFIVPITKSPIVTKEQNVGIGKTNPASALDVKGEILATSLSTTGNVGIGIQSPFSPLHVNTEGKPVTQGNMTNGLIISTGKVGRAINIGTFDNGKNPGSYGWMQSAYVNNGGKHESLVLNPKGGNVGINTVSPKSALDVNGKISATSLTTTGDINTGTGGITTNSFTATGKVGIGTSLPQTVCHIVNNGGQGPGKGKVVKNLLQVDNGLLVDNGNGGTGINIGAVNSPTNASEGYGWIQCGYSNNFGVHNNLALNPIGGKVGIGIDSPTEALDVNGNARVSGNLKAANITVSSVELGVNGKAPLCVGGWIDFKPGKAYFWGYYNITKKSYNGGGQEMDDNAFSTSIHATYCVLAQAFVAISDARIKTNKKISNSIEDLQTLLKLEITDYEYIDQVGKGKGVHKGLIAQQVESIFPQAVSQDTDFIPSIYTMASKLEADLDKEQLSITIDKAHELQAGDLVRLIIDTKEVEKEVVQIIDSKTFVVKDWTETTEKLFVFGKEVDDFRSVDYDAVAMLGVSATQQLHKELQETKKENQLLKAQFNTEMESMKAELAAIKKLITDKV
jgi:hypothetical protein